LSREQVLTIVFRFGTFSVHHALRGIEAVFVTHDLPTTGFASDFGKPTDLAKATGMILRSQESTFNLTGQGFEFDLCSVRNYSLDFLAIKFPYSYGVPCDDWIEQFIVDSNFIVAWLADAEYEYWQNAFDPLQFRSAGRSFEHLPMKSNGLPYPLEQAIVDTSSNPGRRVLREGYIEAVGSVMWFGAPFWTLVHSQKIHLEHLLWARITALKNGVTRIESAKEPFSTAEGESREIQQMLRRALFPSDT
jgi:hypothetical protein